MRITKSLLKKASDVIAYPYSVTLPIAMHDVIKTPHTISGHNVILVMEKKTEFCDTMFALNKNKKTKFLVPIILETIDF